MAQYQFNDNLGGFTKDAAITVGSLHPPDGVAFRSTLSSSSVDMFTSSPFFSNMKPYHNWLLNNSGNQKKKEKYENHGTDYIIHIGSYWGSYASLGSGSGNHMIPASEKKKWKK